ncbi:MAG: YncE family protein [Planctomycetota bacterium]
MIPCFTLRSSLSLAFLLVASPALTAQILAPARVIVSVNTSETSGSLALVDVAPPWNTTIGVAETGARTVVRSYFGRVYAVDPAGCITVFDAATMAELQKFATPDGTTPIDIVVPHRDRAVVTDRSGTALLVLDLQRGVFTTGPDLRALADDDGNPDMARMLQVGNRIYVQVQRTDREGVSQGSLLAVLGVYPNPASRQVVWFDSVIQLNGRRPDHAMQADANGSRLWVSAPGVRRDDDSGVTGIEEIDLTTGTSLGFVFSELVLTADLGGFVMVDDDRGFAIGHTTFFASTHLHVFHRRYGHGGELHAGGGSMESLAFDATTRQVFYPRLDIGDGCVQVWDADTAQPLSGLLPVGGVPFDLLVVR